MTFKKREPNTWVLTSKQVVSNTVDIGDLTNNEADQTWVFRVSILPTPENLKNALNTLNDLEIFKGNNYPPAKIIQFETSDLTTWDGTLADAVDHDQRGKELCVYLPYDSKKKEFVFAQAKIKELMLDIWNALEDAGVEMNYITPKDDEKELSSDPLILTPFCYSSFKPADAPEGILNANDYNPNKYSDPLKGVHFSNDDLQQKGIKKFNTLEISASRIHYMTDHYKTTLDRLNETVLKFENESASSYLSLKERLDKLIGTFDLAKVPEINQFLLDLGASKSFPTNFSKGKRSPILTENEIKHLCTVGTLKEKKSALIKLQKAANKITDQLSKDIITKNCPLSSTLDVIKKVTKTHPFEMQAIQRQLVHLEHENSAINRERLRENKILAPIIGELSKNNKTCLTHLEKIITQEYPELVNAAIEYKEEGNKSAVVDIEKLLTESIQAKRIEVSNELKIAVESYVIITQLDNILNSHNPPYKKLMEFQEKFNSDSIKNKLHSNPDSKVVSFLKRTIYIIANIASLGIVHAITKGSPLMSEQQKLYKKSINTLRNAEKQGVLKKNNPKPSQGV